MRWLYESVCHPERNRDWRRSYAKNLSVNTSMCVSVCAPELFRCIYMFHFMTNKLKVIPGLNLATIPFKVVFLCSRSTPLTCESSPGCSVLITLRALALDVMHFINTPSLELFLENRAGLEEEEYGQLGPVVSDDCVAVTKFSGNICK